MRYDIFLPKIHKILSNVTSYLELWNTNEKVSKFLDFHLKLETQSGKLAIKDSGDFVKKIKSIQFIPSNAILVAVNLVGLYPSIAKESGLKALKKISD